MDGFYFVRVGRQSFGQDFVAEKLTLFFMTAYSSFMQLDEYSSEMLKVFFEGLGENVNVIEMDELANTLIENIVYQMLERGRRVGKFKWHYAKLKGTKGCNKSHFL